MWGIRVPTRVRATRTSAHWWRDARIRKDLGRDGPFLDSVEFGGNLENRYEDPSWVSPCAIFRRDTGIYSRPRWDNIGYFLKPIKTREQCEAAISVLHEYRARLRLGITELRIVVQKIRSERRDPPFKIFNAEVESDLVSKGWFRRDGVWLADMVLIEDASIIQYKYAIDPKNRIARRSKVIVQGPGRPRGAIFEQGVPILGLGNVPPQISTAYRKFSACQKFLWAAGCLNQWKTDLINPDVAKRRAAAMAISSLDSEVVDAVPELTGALADTDAEVRCRAATALTLVGAAAKDSLPALKKALQDKDKRVREIAAGIVLLLGPAEARIEAAQALGRLGCEASSSLPLLDVASKDKNPAVQAAAHAAIDAINPPADGK